MFDIQPITGGASRRTTERVPTSQAEVGMPLSVKLCWGTAHRCMLKHMLQSLDLPTADLITAQQWPMTPRWDPAGKGD